MDRGQQNLTLADLLSSGDPAAAQEAAKRSARLADILKSQAIPAEAPATSQTLKAILEGRPDLNVMGNIGEGAAMLARPFIAAKDSLADGVDLAQRAGVANSLAAVPVAAYEAGKNLLTEGIHTADRWLNSTHQLPGAKPTDTLVAPAGTEDYSINPNRVEGHDVLAPLGLAGIGSPIRNLGRASAAGAAHAERPSSMSEAPRGSVGLSLSQNTADKPGQFKYEIFENGKRVGEANGSVRGNTAEIDFINVAKVLPDGRLVDANSIGLGGVRALREAFRADFPGVVNFEGGRVSGSRGRGYDGPDEYAPRQSVTLLADQNRSSWLGNIANALMGRDDGRANVGARSTTARPSEPAGRLVTAVSVDGKVFAKGPTHFDAVREWKPDWQWNDKDIANLEAMRNSGRMVDGFVTPDGRFLSRQEAAQYVGERPNAYGLESGAGRDRGQVADGRASVGASRETVRPSLGSGGSDIERPVSAAVRVGDKIIPGATHFEALRSAVPKASRDELLADPHKVLRDQFGDAADYDGFVTNTGRYVDRREALALLEKADNYKQTHTDKVMSAGELEAEALNRRNGAEGLPTEAASSSISRTKNLYAKQGMPVPGEDREGSSMAEQGTFEDDLKALEARLAAGPHHSTLQPRNGVGQFDGPPKK